MGLPGLQTLCLPLDEFPDQRTSLPPHHPLHRVTLTCFYIHTHVHTPEKACDVDRLAARLPPPPPPPLPL